MDKVISNFKSSVLLRFMLKLLVITVWVSALLFGLYILAFYFVSLVQGDTAQWNEVLPGLHDAQTKGATVGIGLHFAAGGIILILGCIQLLESVRLKSPTFHRWVGRVYVIASLFTASGGLVFIFIKGTIGGFWMDIAFAGYGLLTFIAAINTIRYARTGNFESHRAWAIRLFALAIGSWLYRMEYGFWFMITDRLWHTSNFTGPFDYFMDFFFYLPNLFVAELFINRRQIINSRWAEAIVVTGLCFATTFLVMATYFFTKEYWGPAILNVLFDT
ncbi:DUF2306 domain-containing protein [Chondrinema litorale]|uniref:DUF2306 domain-containing protein n=1 Tax=Chondrinema litorale TaxID=2994555 RepID=UPI002542E990|nr:DUF2306 domain-containing protein [Chondrinema litorale]UZR94666.1 DUF2306 domain-containing protein [Chondrinema litorale]